MEATMLRKPVSERALFQRVKRALARKDERLVKCRQDSRWYHDLGDYYTTNEKRHLTGTHLDLETLGRDLGVLPEGEALVADGARVGAGGVTRKMELFVLKHVLDGAGDDRRLASASIRAMKDDELAAALDQRTDPTAATYDEAFTKEVQSFGFNRSWWVALTLQEAAS